MSCVRRDLSRLDTLLVCFKGQSSESGESEGGREGGREGVREGGNRERAGRKIGGQITGDNFENTTSCR